MIQEIFPVLKNYTLIILIYITIVAVLILVSIFGNTLSSGFCSFSICKANGFCDELKIKDYDNHGSYCDNIVRTMCWNHDKALRECDVLNDTEWMLGKCYKQDRSLNYSCKWEQDSDWNDATKGHCECDIK